MLLTIGPKLEPMRVLHARKQVKQTEAGLSEPPSEIPLYYQRAISEWHCPKQPQRRCSYNWNAESKHYLVTSLVLPSQDDFSIGIGKCQDVSHSSDTVSETRNSYLLNQNSNSQFQNLGLHHLMVNMVPMTLFLNVYLFILSYTCVSVDANMCILCERVAIEGQERTQGHRKLELQLVVSCMTWVLGTEPGSFSSAASMANHCTISPAPPGTQCWNSPILSPIPSLSRAFLVSAA